MYDVLLVKKISTHAFSVCKSTINSSNSTKGYGRCMHIRLYSKLTDRESYFENFSYDNNTLREEIYFLRNVLLSTRPKLI